MEPDFWSGLAKSQEGPFGVANQYIGDIEKRKAYKLELAMKSQLIEQEVEAKKRQFDYEQSMSPDFLNTFNKQTGANASNLREVQQAQIAQKNQIAVRKLSSGGPLSVRQVNDGMNTKLVWFDKNNPSTIIGEASVGQNPSMLKAYDKVSGDFAEAHKTLDSLRSGVSSLLTNNNMISRWGNAASLSAQSFLNIGDNEVIKLIDNREGIALGIAKSMNGGRPSDPDRLAVLSMLPRKADSLDRALERLDELDGFLKSRQDNSFKVLVQGNTGQRTGGINIDPIKARMRFNREQEKLALKKATEPKK